MIIKSILDTDLYILTMANAVLKLYPNVKVKYKFIDRNKISYPDNFDKFLIQEIKDLEKLTLLESEYMYLKNNYNYFLDEFFIFLKKYKFNSNELKITLDENNRLNIEIEGYLKNVIFWEVPLLALITELYYKTTNKIVNIYDNDIINNDLSKLNTMINGDAKLIEFGTRRRYSFDNQEKIVKLFKDNNKNDIFVGTSNIYLDMKYNLTCVGTMAHLWFMLHAKLYGYKNANKTALNNWQNVYNDKLLIALTDTYTTDVFFNDIDYNLSNIYNGIRQDSGSPFEFIDKAYNHYKKMNINTLSKTIVFSDSLTTNLAVKINNYCKDKFKSSYGIGTYLTNDFINLNIKPTNIVIKLSEVFINDKWLNTVKLSDNITKNTGDENEVIICKKEFNLI